MPNLGKTKNAKPNTETPIISSCIFFLVSGGTFLIRKNTNDKTAIATMSLIIF